MWPTYKFGYIFDQDIYNTFRLSQEGLFSDSKYVCQSEMCKVSKYVDNI